ncbi:MAG: hypothetical protein ACFB0B_14105 [Thermonemataceae bacterium]
MQLRPSRYFVYSERHTEVNWKEKPALIAYTGGLVDVNQRVTFSVNKDGRFKAYIGHGTYPSVEMTVNGSMYYQYSAQSFTFSHGNNLSLSGINPATKINALVTQRISDQLNSKYRTTNRAIFKGFTAAPNGWNYSQLQWKKY